MTRPKLLNTKYKILTTRLKKFRLRTWIFLGVILILAPIVLLNLFKPTGSEAAWFDTNFGFRKQIPITNGSGSTQTNFQLQATIDTAALITEGKMQSDCDDIRFTSISGKVLDYWLEPNTCNTAATLVWFKADSIPTSGAQIYFYYGNASASSGSSPQNTFIKDMTGVVASWPLQETDTTQSYAAVNNSYDDEGRNIVINGGFDSDTAWTKQGSQWSISAGVAHSDGTGGTNQIYQSPLPVTSGKTYSATYTISNYVSGGIKIYIGGSAAGTTRSANGTYTETIIANTAGGSGVNFIPQVSFSGDIDNVSVTQVNIPSSSTISTNLLADGDMEASGTSSWTPTNSPTLTKETTSPFAGTRNLKIARTTINNPYVAQSNLLTVGNVYRIYGYARSDGNTSPRVVNGSPVIWGGNNSSTVWQPFDVVFVASGTVLTFQCNNADGGTEYCEFDNIVVIPDTTIRPGEILQDGDMEASGTSYWQNTNGTISKVSSSPHGGSQQMRLTQTGSEPRIRQNNAMLAGKTYKISGYAKSDGVNSGNLYLYFWSGASCLMISNFISTDWTYFECTGVYGTGWDLQSTITTGYIDFDDISITEVSPLIGLPINGVSLNTASGGHLSKAYSFDGTNDYVNIYSSDLNSAFNPDEGTIVAWTKVSGAGVWSDNTQRNILRLLADGTNYIEIYKNSINNLVFTNQSGGVTKSISYSTSSTGWLQLILTWNKSENQLRAYSNAVQVGSIGTAFGTWIGNLSSSSTVIGSSSTSGNSPWSGLINDVHLYNRALSAEEISSMYSASSDIQAYYSENYTGHELLRKYNTSVTLGAQATEEVGPGPVAYWNFNEGQGQTVNDSTSNNNDGTLGANSGSASDDPTWVTEDQCVSGKCLKFEGGDEVKTTALPSTQSGSYSIWVKPKSLAAQEGWINSGGEASTGFDIFQWNDGRIYFRAGTTSNQNSVAFPSSWVPNSWHHLAMTWNGTTMYGYIDGQQVTTISQNGMLSGEIQLGRVDGGFFLNGFIDEPKVYPYARTAAQVKADYNLGYSTLLGQQTQKNFLSDGLVGYWKMDEASWTNNCSTDSVLDSSGNGNHGDACPNSTGPTGGAAGKFGNGGSFDGNDDSITVPHTTSLQPTTQITVSAWVNLSALGGGYRWIARKGYGGAPYFFGKNDNNKVVLVINDDSNLWGSSTAPPATTGLHHWVGTYDGKNIRIYIDGQDTGFSYAKTGGLTGSTAALILGGLDTNSDSIADSQRWNGSMDEVRIYNRALSAAEVSALYNWAPGPVGYWKMDEASWNGTSGEVIDSSGNGNNGTSSGNTSISDGKYGNGGLFDGNGDYQTFTDDPLDVGSGSFTLGAWVKAPAPPDQTFFIDKRHTYGGAGAGYTLSTEASTNSVQLRLADGTNGPYTFDGVKNVMDNQWHYIAAVVDRSAGNVKMYTDGVLENGAQSLGTLNSISNSLQVRTGIKAPVSPTTNALNGKIDEVKIYNYARTPSQIIEDMNGGHPIGGSPVGSPLAYYSFDEQSGQTANNTGNGGASLNGTLGATSGASTDDPTWKTAAGGQCKTNGCLSFDGGDFVNMGDISGVNGSQLTITAWVNHGVSSTLQRIISKWGGGSQKSLTFRRDSTNSYVFDISGTGSDDIFFVTTNTFTDTNTWVHLAAVYDGTTQTIKVYVNGNNQVGNITGTVPATIFDGTDPLEVGRLNSQYFTGKIDEVKIYNTALTAGQVKLDMNSGAGINLGSTASSEATLISDGAGNPPVAYWPMDEKQDNTCTGGTNDVCDKSGNNLDGAITGATWTKGKVGGALSFTGNEYVDLGNSSNYIITGNVSVGAWVKTTSSGTSRAIVAKYGNNSAYTWRLYMDTNGKAGFNRGAPTIFDTSIVSSRSINDGQWHYVVGYYDGTNMKIFVDGREENSVAENRASDDLPNWEACIGDDSYTCGVAHGYSGWVGSIDDIKIYDYARTQAQIAYDYNRGLPIGHWQLDECEGTTANDNSGNANHGTITIGASGEDTVGDCTTSSTAWGSGASGKVNSSLDFDGVDDYIQTGTTGFSASYGTLSAWVKPSATGSYQYIAMGSANPNRIYMGRNGSGNFTIQLGSSSEVNTNISIPQNSWSLVSLTWNNGTYHTYVNGVQVGTGAYSGLNGIGSCGNIGSYNDCSSSRNTFFNGQIDDVRVYNYPLSASQVKLLYNGGAGAKFGPSEGQP